MLHRLILALALVAGVSAFGPSAAQAQSNRVVQSCGALPSPLRVGDSSADFVDVAGNKCTAPGTGSGSGAAVGATPNAGGVSNYSRIPSSAATNNLTLAKAGVSRAYTYQACNTTASTIYMRLYNAASTGAVTVGTTAVFAGPYAFPANTCIQVTDFANNIGTSMSAGIVYAFGTTPADNDTTTIGAGAIVAFQLGYQ